MGAEGEKIGLFRHVPRILGALHRVAPGRVIDIMECTPMRSTDLQLFNTVFGWGPFEVDA